VKRIHLGAVHSKRNEVEYSKDVIFAKSFIYWVIYFYWSILKSNSKTGWKLRKYNYKLIDLNKQQLLKAKSFAESLAGADTLEAGYSIANKYMTLLPKSFRRKYGIFFTPVPVVEKMICDAENAGIDFNNASVIDPCAGGAAFLAPLCRKMISSNFSDHQTMMDDLLSRLKGFEIDSFSAWLSQFMIDCELSIRFPTCKRPKPIVECIDALFVSSKHFGLYDLVIGNPPYGKIFAKQNLKDRYSDVLYGTPNLYQLFYSLALDLAKSNGMIQLITPTSFIGGNYFKQFREAIEKQACPVRFDFFESRAHIFEGVLQELVIAIFRKGKLFKPAPIFQVRKNGNSTLSIEKIGSCIFPKKGLWVLPKDKDEAILSILFNRKYETLETLGFKIKTGYIVPHRSKELLGNHKEGKRSFPLIWSEAISKNCFDPEKAFNKGKQRWYYQPLGKCTGLITESVVLIKRISSKEQLRRIHSAIVPSGYLEKSGGFFVENHINVLYASDSHDIKLETLQRVLKH
jgi:adenine-specific DNA-methyltransferase